MDRSTRGRHDAGVVTLELWGTSRAKGAVNEDAYLIDAAHRLFGVFDGLGATSQAALAATLAAQAVQAAYRDRGLDQGCEAERAFLSLAVQGAGTLLAATLEDGLTTASVVKVCDTPDGGATAVICNIGDSRVYRYTTAGELQQCTLDDSAFGADWDLQLRLSETVAPTGLLDYLYLERRHILDRALGQRGDTPRLWETGAEAGDVLVAVTDGVTDNLTFSEARTLLDNTRECAQQAGREEVMHLVHPQVRRRQPVRVRSG